MKDLDNKSNITFYNCIRDLQAIIHTIIEVRYIIRVWAWGRGCVSLRNGTIIDSYGLMGLREDWIRKIK